MNGAGHEYRLVSYGSARSVHNTKRSPVVRVDVEDVREDQKPRRMPRTSTCFLFQPVGTIPLAGLRVSASLSL